MDNGENDKRRIGKSVNVEMDRFVQMDICVNDDNEETKGKLEGGNCECGNRKDGCCCCYYYCCCCLLLLSLSLLLLLLVLLLLWVCFERCLKQTRMV